MAAPLAKQVLMAIGGDVAAKYGTLVWRKGLQTRGGEIPYTFTRTGNGLYLANDVSAGGLVVKTASGGNARAEQLVDPVNGVLQNYLKLEGAATNSCLQSQTWNTAPWVPAAAPVTNNAATAPDGTTTASSIIPDATNTSGHRDSQPITVTANEFLALSGFFKNNGYPGLNYRMTDAGGTNSFGIIVDLSSGASVTAIGGGGVISGSAVIALAGGWYWVGVWGTMGGGVTAGNVFANVFDTYAHAQSLTAYAGDTVKGIYTWGAQLERNGANAVPPTSYIPTTTIAVARGTERFSVPFFVGPGNRWVYVRLLERVGSSLTTGFMDLCGISGASWTQRIYGPGAATGYAGRNDPSGPQNDTAIAGGNRSLFGEVVELLLLCPDDRTVQIKQSRNGGADVVSSIGAAQASAYASSYGSTTLTIGENGSLLSNELFSRVVVGLGAGTTVNTIADVRNTL